MPFGTGYFALRCKAGFVFISPLIIGTEESGQTYTQKKNLKDLPKLEKFLELLHTREKTTIVRKKKQALGVLLNGAFLPSNHCVDSKQCVHHQLVEERDILYLFPTPLHFSSTHSLET